MLTAVIDDQFIITPFLFILDTKLRSNKFYKKQQAFTPRRNKLGFAYTWFDLKQKHVSEVIAC